MKILITGAAGFLGLHLTKHLHSHGHALALLNIAPYDKNEYPNAAKNLENLKYVIGDVRNSTLINSLVPGCDVVIHAAAALPLWQDRKIHDTNVNGTKTVLEAALQHNIKHVVFVSSTAVYGIPKVHPIFEDAPLVGVGAYGKSKIAAEGLCEQYRQKGLLITTLRPKTFVGTHRLGIFEILFDWIRDGKKIPIIGNGKNRYQLLDVDDLTNAIYQLLTHPNKNEINTTFNVGAQTHFSVKNDLETLFSYTKSGSRVISTPAWAAKKLLWLFEKTRLSPVYQWIYDSADKDSYVSIDKLTSVAGFVPRFSNSQALIKSYQWYLDNYAAIKSRPTGITHTTGWNQGILGLIKKLL